MEIQFIDIKRAVLLEDIVGWLSGYTGPEEGVLHEVRVNGVRDEELTAKLKRLGEINKERLTLLAQLEYKSI